MSEHDDPVAAALKALMRGDVDAPIVRDVMQGRVRSNLSDRDLVAELRDVVLRVQRHCGANPRSPGDAD